MLSIRWAVSAISFHVESGHNFNLQVDVAIVYVYTFQDYCSKHQEHVSSTQYEVAIKSSLNT